MREVSTPELTSLPGIRKLFVGEPISTITAARAVRRIDSARRCCEAGSKFRDLGSVEDSGQRGAVHGEGDHAEPVTSGSSRNEFHAFNVVNEAGVAAGVSNSLQYLRCHVRGRSRLQQEAMGFVAVVSGDRDAPFVAGHLRRGVVGIFGNHGSVAPASVGRATIAPRLVGAIMQREATDA